MTPREAIEAAAVTNQWFRPVTWRDRGDALCVHDGRILVVPSLRGGYRWCPYPAELCCEFEAVEPGEVLTERDEP